ncbi:MAG TPA: MotA/TolQ/ExbB proton channel family protein [Kofleriaceae bacterium]|jgi:biopolymer transport protein ExbB/TolQ|nr:MotA/TolQ/ExbB proton channel family protein [Kofleriaceae bacterium]
MDLSHAFVDFAQLGANWVLWLLVGLSVVSVGVMIDRALWFRNRDTDSERFIRELRGAFDRGEIDRLNAKYLDDPAVPLQVALRGLAVRSHGAEAVAEAMHSERARWRRAADRNLIILGTLGNNVPFVGLFGTVLGVINAFQHLALKSADAEKETLSTIAEALSATAIGLLVAIPAVIAFNFFSRKVRVLMGSADEIAHAVLAMIHGAAHDQPGARPAADKTGTEPAAADQAGQDKAHGGR